MEKVLAFPAWQKMSPADIKKFLVDSAVDHRKKDQYIKGSYGKMNGEFKGCSIGCCNHDLMTLKGEKWDLNSHQELEKHSGLPAKVGVIVDLLFENLPENESVKLTEQVFAAIPEGADLSKIWHLFTVWALTDKKWGIIQFVNDEQKPRTQLISDLLFTETTRKLTENETKQGDEASWESWESRASRASWASWESRESWASRASWESWESRASRASWASWESRESWASRASWASWESRESRASWESRESYLIAAKRQLIKLLKAAKPA